MKEPIEAKDIRKGDLIRKEYRDNGTIRATEYRAAGDVHGCGTYGGTFFRLEHAPKPPVILPTEPGVYLTAINMKSGPFLVVLDSSGDWHDFSLGHADRKGWTPEIYAPLTKLEPVAETARKMRDAIRVEFESSSGSYEGDVNAVAAAFGVDS